MSYACCYSQVSSANIWNPVAEWVAVKGTRNCVFLQQTTRCALHPQALTLDTRNRGTFILKRPW